MPKPVIDFEVRGANRIANNFRGAAAAFPQTTNQVVSRWTKDSRAALKAKPYPPKRPFQKYVRTGQLANRWSAKQKSLGVWRIVNEARARGKAYAGWVVRESTQAWMHKGRWWTIEKVLGDRLPDLRTDLVKALKRKMLGR